MFARSYIVTALFSLSMKLCDSVSSQCSSQPNKYLNCLNSWKANCCWKNNKENLGLFEFVFNVVLFVLDPTIESWLQSWDLCFSMVIIVPSISSERPIEGLSIPPTPPHPPPQKKKQKKTGSSDFLFISLSFRGLMNDFNITLHLFPQLGHTFNQQLQSNTHSRCPHRWSECNKL